MENIDIDKVLEVMGSPEVGENSLNVMEMLTELNKVLSKVQHTMNLVESMGFKPLLVRAAGQKLGVDAESPLKCEKAEGIMPKTEYHRQVLEQFNNFNEEQLGKMLSVLLSEESKSAIEEPSVELGAAE